MVQRWQLLPPGIGVASAHPGTSSTCIPPVFKCTVPADNTILPTLWSFMTYLDIGGESSSEQAGQQDYDKVHQRAEYEHLELSGQHMQRVVLCKC